MKLGRRKTNNMFVEITSEYDYGAVSDQKGKGLFYFDERVTMEEAKTQIAEFIRERCGNEEISENKIEIKEIELETLKAREKK